MTRQARREKWDEIIRDLQSSGLNPNQYASQHKISKTSLYYHLKKRKQSTNKQQEPRGLVHEVKLSELKVYAKPEMLRMSLGDADLTFSELPDPHWLAALIRGLETR